VGGGANGKSPAKKVKQPLILTAVGIKENNANLKKDSQERQFTLTEIRYLRLELVARLTGPNP